MSGSPPASGRMRGLVIGALGVVYGDIGTSPLYALRECFHQSGPLPVSPANVLGVLSLLIWSLVLVVSVKYLGVVMRADNRGEGGIMALMALTIGRLPRERTRVLVAMGVFGAALLYGDGVITPAITVLSAIEGLQVAAPQFRRFVVPLTVAILIALFSVQRFGTGRVGKAFGPVTCLWFLALAALGARGLIDAPEILGAFNPWHGMRFIADNGFAGFVVLGAVFLAVTGAEALYADMGHFGRRPIRIAWFALVFPALVLNYLGQGALLLRDASAAENPFYRLAPSWFLLPLVALATAAGVIASQALISGVFSLTMQAMQLGYVPRLNLQHTSSTERGQIYIAPVNWALMAACVGLVLGFRSSNSLAAAYGIAVTLTMLLTSGLLFFAARSVWRWPLWQAALVTGLFVAVEFAFFGANLLKFSHGGWFPLALGVLIYTLMSTWRAGRQLVGQRLREATLPLGMFLEEIRENPPPRVPGTAVFMTGNPDGTPGALLHNLKHNKVLHERTIVLRLASTEVPHVDPADRVQIEKLPAGFFRVTGFFGFMEGPDLDVVRAACARENIVLDPMQTTYFLGRETIIASSHTGLARWRKRLFALMSRNAQTPAAFFRLPPNRVVELGMQVEI